MDPERSGKRPHIFVGVSSYRDARCGTWLASRAAQYSACLLGRRIRIPVIYLRCTNKQSELTQLGPYTIWTAIFVD